jgi:membrane dipeptidase
MKTESLSRRRFVATAAGAGAVVLLGRAWREVVAESTDPRLAKVIASTIAIDMHNHVYPAGISQSRGPGGWGGLLGQQQEPELSLEKELNRAGLTAVCAAYELDFTPIAKPGDARDNYLRWIAALDRQLEREHLHRAFNLKDLQVAHQTRRPAVIHAVEGAQFIEGKVERVEEVYKRGLRHLQLLHDRDDLVSRLGDTDNGRDHMGGLTPVGKEVVKECNRLGIVVDLAHAAPQTILDATKVISQPFVISHAGPVSHVADKSPMSGMMGPRLLNRERAKVVADAGGVIGVWKYMADSVPEYVQNMKAMVDLAGIDHVGIGTDTNILSSRSGQATNEALPDVRAGFFYAIAGEMLRQGFSVDEIVKVGGGNYCRVFDKVTAGRA